MSFKELEYELAIQLDSAGFGVFGAGPGETRNIYVGEWPEDLQEGILVMPVPSPPPHQYIDTEYKVVDFWARSPHSDRGKALLRQVFEYYDRRYAFSTGTWYVSFSRILGDIEDASRDIEGGKLFRLSIQFISRNLNHVS